MNASPSLPCALGALLLAGLIGCTASEEPTADEQQAANEEASASEEASGTEPTATAGALAGTAWQLAELQSMDDAIGTTRPDDPSLYTMTLNTDGTASLRLNCNRGTANWSAAPAAGAESGTFSFGPMAMTRALCPEGSLDERLAREAEYVRSYLLRDGRLNLSLMADGGIQVWEPLAE